MAGDLLDLATVCSRTGLSRTTLCRRMQAGLFPPPLVGRGNRLHGWFSRDIEAWLANRDRFEPQRGRPLKQGQTTPWPPRRVRNYYWTEQHQARWTALVQGGGKDER